MIQQFYFWEYIQRKQTNKQTKLSQRDIYTSVLVAALFTIAKIRKQPNCPLMDERI